jgi:glycosyltransferase involved in cell wall biosynthesis
MQREDPLVTVVIPAYNRVATIGAALESVRTQSYPRWEVVVVDDGSQDGTAGLVEERAKQDARIRLIREARNRGAQGARNIGIRAARGEWICFLDSDDQYLPDSIERRLRVAKEANLSVVHSECYVREYAAEPRLYNVSPVRGPSYRRLLVGEGPVFPAFFITREALERIGYLDENILAFQEWDTAIRLAKHYDFGFEPKPTFIYDCRGSDMMSKDLLRGARGYLQILHKHFVAMLRYGGPTVIASHYQTAARWYRNGGDLAAARRCERKARVWTVIDRPCSVVRKLRRAVGRAWSLVSC